MAERHTIKNLFSEICDKDEEWSNLPKETKDAYIRRMERSCFNYIVRSCAEDGIDRLFTEPKFVARYSTICSKVLANLDNSGSIGSSYLIKKIINGDIDVNEIASMTSENMCPDASKVERKIIELRRNQKVEIKVSRAYTCRKCGKSETIPIEYHHKGSDESSSYSIKCVHCEFVWRK